MEMESLSAISGMRNQRGSYNAHAAATALERSLYHFGKHVG